MNELFEILEYVTNILKEQNSILEQLNKTNLDDIEHIDIIKKYSSVISKGDLCIDIINKIEELIKKYQ